MSPSHPECSMLATAPFFSPCDGSDLILMEGRRPGLPELVHWTAALSIISVFRSQCFLSRTRYQPLPPRVFHACNTLLKMGCD